MNQKELEECKNYERQILRAKGLQPSHFKVSECPLTETDFIHYVQIKKTKQTPDNILLMAHGYMGSNIGFFKFYQALQNDFHIFSIDLPGQGLSSSTEETPKSADAWVDYFTSNVKRFVDKMGIKRFSICGHSMGAFVLTHFASRFPEMINEVYLLSPGGVNFENPEFEEKKKNLVKGINCMKRGVMQSMANSIFKDKKAPLSLWYLTLFRGSFAKMIYGGKRLGLDKEEQKFFIPLYQSIYKSKPSSDKCLGYIFKEGPMSDRPLMKVFEKLHDKKRIVIYYGRRDWMDYQYTMKQLEQKELDIDVDFVNDCDHQIVFQNPLEAAQMMINRKNFWEEQSEAEQEKVDVVEK